MKHQRSPLPSPSENSNKSVSTWALPEGAIHRIGEGKIQDIAFTTDGDALVCGTSIGVWWYDLSTVSPTPIAVWETERGMVSTVAFSGGGERLVVGNSDGIVKVLDVPAGVCITGIGPLKICITSIRARSPMLKLWEESPLTNCVKKKLDINIVLWYNYNIVLETSMISVTSL